MVRQAESSLRGWLSDAVKITAPEPVTLAATLSLALATPR